MNQLRLLVVEDDDVVGFLLGQILEGLGHEVIGIESNADGAIAAAKRYRPDLMIVDEQLGRESGLAVMEAVLQDGPMDHIFVSGDTSRIRKLKPSAVVLEKPYFETDLENAIWRALGSSHAMSHLGSPPRQPLDQVAGSGSENR